MGFSQNNTYDRKGGVHEKITHQTKHKMDHIFFKSLPQKDLFFGTFLGILGVKYDINKSHVLPKGEGDFAKRS